MIFRDLASHCVDDQGRVQWDFLEDALFNEDNPKVTMLPRRADGTWGEHSGSGKCYRFIPIGRLGSLRAGVVRPHSNQTPRPHISHPAENRSAAHGLHDPYSAIRTWAYV